MITQRMEVIGMNNEERILEVLAAMRADMESMKANMSD